MKSGFQVSILHSDESFAGKPGESLLVAMMRQRYSSIPVGCRSGGCGVCKVHVKCGDYSIKKMSRAHVSEDEEKQGFVLACRCYPSGSLDVEVVGPVKESGLN